MQGKLIAVAYTLRTYWNSSSLWAEFVNKNRCIGVRGGYKHWILMIHIIVSCDQNISLNILCQRWIPCQASTSVLCLHYRPVAVHCSTKHACIKSKENRIYIRGEFTRKKCKTAILLYCFHTAGGVLNIFMLYNVLGPGISFYRKSKINVKRKPNYEIGWFHNWPMIISHRLYAFHFTNDDFPL